jgi:hypothetical protein
LRDELSRITPARADIGAACMLSTEPCIFPFEMDSELLARCGSTSSTSFQDHEENTLSNGVPNLSFYETDLSNVLVEIRSLIALFETNKESNTLAFDNIAYSDRVYFIRRSLHYLQHHPTPHSKRIDLPLAIAASIFVDSCIRDMGFHVGIICIMVARLKDHLVFFEDDVIEFPNKLVAQKILCVFALGAVAALGKVERPWFVAWLALACRALGITRWEKLEPNLKAIIWKSNWESPRGMLWSEVRVLLKP